MFKTHFKIKIGLLKMTEIKSKLKKYGLTPSFFLPTVLPVVETTRLLTSMLLTTVELLSSLYTSTSNKLGKLNLEKYWVQIKICNLSSIEKKKKKKCTQFLMLCILKCKLCALNMKHFFPLHENNFLLFFFQPRAKKARRA